MPLVKTALLGIFLNGLALYMLTLIIEVIYYTGGLKLFVISGIILGLVNTFIKPILKIFSLPLIILTGGLFLILLNGIVLWLLTYLLQILDFRDVVLVFPNVLSYVIGGVVFGVINWAVHLSLK